jgi:hypothetical protein
VSQPLGQLGKYLLVRELGRGGMGVVYEARDAAHPDRELALKLILAQGASQEELARFQREALALARFSHKHVVPVHDLIDTPRGPCLITDLIRGEDLAAVRKKQELSTGECARLVRDVADGVQALHDEGIVHRDLKPHNVMLTPDGRPVLLDFGLARQRGAESLTQTGAILGTPAYMSPEQAGGEERVDELTDVYALGAVLYYLITGGAPYRGSAIQVLHQVLRGAAPPSPSSSGATSHPHLDAICLKAMAPSPRDRYPSAGHLRDALDQFLDPPQPTRRRALALAAAGLVVLLAAFAFLRLRGQETTLPREVPALLGLLAKGDELPWKEALDSGALLLGDWLRAYPEHDARADVEAWRLGYEALAGLTPPDDADDPPRTDLAALDDWLERYADHPARQRVQGVRDASADLGELLATLRQEGEGSPLAARRALKDWGDQHPERPAYPGAAWLTAQLEGCDEADRVMKIAFPTPEQQYAALRRCETRYPDLPAPVWFGETYRRLALEIPVWSSPKPTKCKRPRVRFLPGEPLRFVTWGYESWVRYEPLRVWLLDAQADPPVSSRVAVRFKGAAVLDLAPAPDGRHVSLLLGMLDAPKETTTALVPRFELPTADAEVDARELIASQGGTVLDVWARWLARADPPTGPVLALAGNRNQRDPQSGAPLANDAGQILGEGVIRVLRQDQVLEHVADMPARALALSHDGARLAVGSGYFNSEHIRGAAERLRPQRVTVFDASSSELTELDRNARLAATPGHVGFLPGSTRLVISDNSNNVLVFDDDLNVPQAQLEGVGAKVRWGVGRAPAHNGAARGFVVDAGRRHLLSICGEERGEGRSQNEIRVWRLDALDQPDLDAWRLLNQPKPLFYVDLGPDHWLLIGTQDGVELRRWFHGSDEE